MKLGRTVSFEILCPTTMFVCPSNNACISANEKNCNHDWPPSECIVYLFSC